MLARGWSGGRARAARRIAAAAAYGAAFGGGGAGLLGASALALLAAQAARARRRIPQADQEPPDCDGRYGAGLPGVPLRLALLGDSSAAGYGCEHARHSPGAVMARGLAAAANRPVDLRCLAEVGAKSTDLPGQVAGARSWQPDVVVVMVGANDVTHRVRPSTSVAALATAVRDLRAGGSQVVVGTCPDLGTIEPVAQPLRHVARRMSRRLAAAQTIAVVESGGRTVSLGDLLGPEFAARPGEMFGPDRFHPSPAGYRAAALALLPSVLATLELAPTPGTPSIGGLTGRAQALPGQPDRLTGGVDRAEPVSVAATRAVETPGAEVAGTQVGGDERGPWGRWALLRRRRATREPEPAYDGEPAPVRPAQPAYDAPDPGVTAGTPDQPEPQQRAEV